MAILMAIMVSSPCSIAEARDHLPELIRGVERGKPVEISRRGKVVAVVVSLEDYRRMSVDPKALAKALRAFMATRPKGGVFTAEEVAKWRDRGPGRRVRL
jgi:prevent-host-death family protein